MAAIIYILLPIVLSGLGFLTYQHPTFARKILYVLLSILAVCFLSSYIYNEAQIQENIKVKNEIAQISIISPIVKMNPDSSLLLESPLTHQHYLSKIIKDNQVELSIIMFEEKREREIKQQAVDRINKLDQIIEERNRNTIIYSVVTFLILFTLFVLSYYFENMQNKKVKPNNSTKKTTSQKSV